MKSDIKNKNIGNKKNMNATANVVEVFKKCNKKSLVWKNKSSKLTKTLVGGTIAEKPNFMTEDDI